MVTIGPTSGSFQIAHGWNDRDKPPSTEACYTFIEAPCRLVELRRRSNFFPICYFPIY